MVYVRRGEHPLLGKVPTLQTRSRGYGWFCKIKFAAPTAPNVPPPAASELLVLPAAPPLVEPPTVSPGLAIKSCTRYNLF